MRFRKAVEQTPGLEDAYRAGLQALRGADRGYLTASSPRALAGSVDLDQALRESRPAEPRWDYAIGVKQADGEQVVWVEIHPASSHHVEDVLRKLAWLKSWLRNEALDLGRLPGKFYWVATKGVAIQPGSTQYKRLAERGLRLKGGRLEV